MRRAAALLLAFAAHSCGNADTPARRLGTPVLGSLHASAGETRRTEIALERPPLSPLRTISLHTTTMNVEDLAVDRDSLWAATRGGLERYDLESGQRIALFRTTEGLDHNHIRAVTASDGIEVRTLHSRCRLDEQRFSCEPLAWKSKGPVVAPRFMDDRVTASVEASGVRYIATATRGVWRDASTPVRLTPGDQVCSNHVMAMASFAGRLWLGTFDEGVCSTTDGEAFEDANAPLRMVNDMQVVDAHLYVAASEGLFRSSDGVDFEAVAGVRARGVNGIAFDDETIFATTPAAIWQLPRSGGRSRAVRRPGGTRAMQGIEYCDGALWIPSEDRGVIRWTPTSTEVVDRLAGLPSSWVLDIAHSRDGRLYAGTLRHGLVAIEPGGAYRVIEGIDPWILEVDALDGAIWVGTQDGAARIVGEAITHVPSLPNPNVHAFHEWQGRVWVGTEGGLAVVETAAQDS